MPAEAGDVLELDELWSFVGSKANVRRVWIALCRQTRQIVACFVGDRSANSARALRERIPSEYRCRATRSDFWLACEEAFPRRTHRLCGKDAGQTNHAERFFCTLRQRLGRFVRKTLSCSMHEEPVVSGVAARITRFAGQKMRDALPLRVAEFVASDHPGSNHSPDGCAILNVDSA